MLTNYLWGGGWGGADDHNHGGGTGTGKTGHKDLSSLIRDEEEKDLEDTVLHLDELADRLLTQFPAYGTNHLHLQTMSSSQGGGGGITMSQQDAADWLLSSSGPGGDDDDNDNQNHNHGDATTSLHNQPFVDQNGQPLPAATATTATGTSLVESRVQLHQQQPPPSTNNSKTMTMAMSSSSIPQNVTTNWDYDEQYLWKAVGEEKESHHHEPASRSRGGGYANSSNSHANNHHRNGGGRSYLALQADTEQHPNQQQQQQWMYGKNINYHYPETGDETSSNPAVVSQNHSKSTTAGDPKQPQSSTAQTNNDTATNSTDAGDFYNSRQHWMPDQLCKQCYACDTPFTVFRRRHHCRLCGQVFCSSCSAFFVPSQHSKQKKGTSSTLRTCQMCHEQVTQKGGLLLDTKEDGGSSVVDGVSHSGAPGADPPNSTSKEITDAAATTNKIEEIVTTPDGRPVVTDHKTLTIQTSPSALSSKSKTDPHHHPAPLRDQHGTPAQTDATPTAAVPTVWIDRDQSQGVPAPTTHWHAPAAVSSEQPPPPADTPLVDEQQPTPSTTATTTTKKKEDVVDANKEAKRHLGLTAANHLEMMGASLLKKDAPLLLEEIQAAVATKQRKHQQHQHQQRAQEIQKQWLQKLMTLATRCCATVEPNVKKGDLLDIRPYVKIKGESSLVYLCCGCITIFLLVQSFVAPAFVLSTDCPILFFVNTAVIPGGSFQDCAVSSCSSLMFHWRPWFLG